MLPRQKQDIFRQTQDKHHSRLPAGHQIVLIRPAERYFRGKTRGAQSAGYWSLQCAISSSAAKRSMIAISFRDVLQIIPISLLEEAGRFMISFWPVVAIVLLIVVLLVVRSVLSRRRKPPLPEPDLRIDLESFHPEPPPESPGLEFFGLPVRLVVLVLAPAGRDGILPPTDQRNELFESIVPGLAEVVQVHRPLVVTWPPQLSAQGFIHRYFQNVRLPGDRGRGTPWCSAAGPARSSGQVFLVGMTCYAVRPNHFSQEVIQHEGDWYRLFRVTFRS